MPLPTAVPPWGRIRNLFVIMSIISEEALN